MAGWRCFHMCALVIFFLSCKESGAALGFHTACSAAKPPETEPEPLISHHRTLNFPRTLDPELLIPPCKSLAGDYYARFSLLVAAFCCNVTYSFGNGLWPWWTYNYQASAQAAWPKFSWIYYRHRRRTCTRPWMMLSVACVVITQSRVSRQRFFFSGLMAASWGCSERLAWLLRELERERAPVAF